jgi:RNA polymerase II-associated protein 2
LNSFAIANASSPSPNTPNPVAAFSNLPKMSTPAPAPAAAAAAAPRTVASAVLRVQMALLDGAAVSSEALIHAAASALLSRADYDDVVTERTISDACGNPACPNPLPSSAAATGPRFHIALSEHRVYDLEEACKFCSERCLVASKALAASLPHDRPYTPTLQKSIIGAGARPPPGVHPLPSPQIMKLVHMS